MPFYPKKLPVCECYVFVRLGISVCVFMCHCSGKATQEHDISKNAYKKQVQGNKTRQVNNAQGAG